MDEQSTANRHRISTMFMALDVPQSERDLFYKHMGHSERMNMDTYQIPPAIQEVTIVGKTLMNFDKGKEFVSWWHIMITEI